MYLLDRQPDKPAAVLRLFGDPKRCAVSVFGVSGGGALRKRGRIEFEVDASGLANLTRLPGLGRPVFESSVGGLAIARFTMPSRMVVVRYRRTIL